MRAPPVFVLGAARSGTSWVQQLLGAHPRVVTPPETHLAFHYLLPLQTRWEHEVAALEDLAERMRGAATPERRVVGLPTVLTSSDIDDALRFLVDRLTERALGLKPGAEVVVEKSPSNSRAVEVLARAAPEGRFIHVIRDPRDVVASVVRAAGGWGRRWAPSSARDAALGWRRNLLGARKAAVFGDRYREVRYEDIWASPGEHLQHLLAFCGQPSSRQVCDELGAQVALHREEGTAGVVLGGEAGRLIRGAVREPDGFYGPGKPGAWQHELDPSAWAEIDEVAGDLVVSLGYAPDRDWSRADTR